MKYTEIVKFTDIIPLPLPPHPINKDEFLQVLQLLCRGLGALVRQEMLKRKLRVSQLMQREGVAGQTEVDVILGAGSLL